MSRTFVFRDSAGKEYPVAVDSAPSLAQAVYTSGHAPAPALCSGLGRCGRCAMRFVSHPPAPLPEDEELLTPEELAAGWRLGCRHVPQEGQVIELPPPPRRERAGVNIPAATAAKLVMAVDLGTTSMHWQILDALNPDSTEPFPSGSELNPQMGAGSEVMSRLAYAATPENAARLRRLVLDRLGEILQDIPPVQELCIAGNTAMTCLLLGKSLDGLAHAPYHLEYFGGETVDLCASDTPPFNVSCSLPPAYIPPQFSPFVGGDISAGLAHIRFGSGPDVAPPAYPWLLADFGTNGEFALMLDDKTAVVASVALGPAIEGIGLSHGGVATPGAVAGFDLTPMGLVARCIPGELPAGLPPRITGAGYLSLLQRLRSTGLLNEKGHFATVQTASISPLARKLALGLELEKGLLLPSIGQKTRPARLLSADIEAILQVKAACNTALSRLLHHAGLGAHQLNTIFVAGALGQHTGARNLEELGFIPPGSSSRVQLLGNASLAGASLFLTRPETRAWGAALANNIRVLDLAGEPGFFEEYFQRMSFTYVP